MPFFHGMAVAACAAAAWALSLSASAPSSGLFHTAEIGPGVTNLSPRDDYAQYQWGLKNDGDLQLVEIRNRFSYGGSAYTAPDDDSLSGLPIPNEPGNYEVLTTNAAAGIDINILPAWELYDASQTNRDVTVAVIDTGLDIFHPDLVSSVWINEDEIPGDGIDNDGNGYTDDIWGWDFFYDDPFVFNPFSDEDTHGTHVAGTIAAGRKNGGITGITGSEHVKIMSLKALGTSQGVGSPEDVIRAIQYAEANGATICNLSFCSDTCTPELEAAIRDSSMLFIVAAGNGDSRGIGYNIDETPTYPACLPFDNIITVSNLMFDGNLDSSSNYGVQNADLAAPGTYIVSTIPKGYGFLSGTSMAAPMVTGAAALLYSYRSDFTIADVRTALLQSVRQLDSLSSLVSTGGMLDMGAALLWEKTP